MANPLQTDCTLRFRAVGKNVNEHTNVRSREEVHSIRGQSFLSAYVPLKNFDGPAQFSIWLTRIAINRG